VLQVLAHTVRRSQTSPVGRLWKSGLTQIAVLAVLLALAVASERRGNPRYPWIDLATGCALIVAAVWTTSNRPLPGLLLLASASSWFVVTAGLAGSWTDELLYVHRALVVQALLVSSGRLSVVRVAAIGVAYVGAIDLGRARSTRWLAATALAAVAVLALDTVRRRSSWRFAAAAATSVVLWWSVPGFFFSLNLLHHPSGDIVYGIGLTLSALTVALAGTSVLRPADIGSADIVRDGGRADVRIAFRAPGRTEFEDVDGRPFAAADGEHVARMELGGDLGEALVALPTAVDPASAAADLSDGLRLLAANRRALQVLRTQAGEVAASEQRIRQADERAAEQVGLELNRLVVSRIDNALDLLGDDEPDSRTALLEVLAEVRALATGLAPVALDSGLRAALVSLAAEQPVPVDAEVADVRLSQPAARALYFAAAECLTNAIRHASASRLELSLVAENGRAELTISDNGRGGATLVPEGGLAGLASRLAALGGHIEIRATGEGGTAITVHLPLDDPIS
jgi:signal transduction histidine kinase